MASASASYAQSGPFAGLAGTWSGGGTVTLDDGSRERIRCRASYHVAGPQMNMSLTCASDAYKFNLAANVVDEGGQVSGSWSESSRNVSGVLQGRGGGGNFQVVASTAGFNSNISLRTVGNKQTVTMRAEPPPASLLQAAVSWRATQPGVVGSGTNSVAAARPSTHRFTVRPRARVL